MRPNNLLKDVVAMEWELSIMSLHYLYLFPILLKQKEIPCLCFLLLKHVSSQIVFLLITTCIRFQAHSLGEKGSFRPDSTLSSCSFQAGSENKLNLDKHKRGFIKYIENYELLKISRWYIISEVDELMSWNLNKNQQRMHGLRMLFTTVA